MSTLEGAVPLGIGITKLRLWDELHRVHCESMKQSRQAASDAENLSSTTHPGTVRPASSCKLLRQPPPSDYANFGLYDESIDTLQGNLKKRRLSDVVSAASPNSIEGQQRPSDPFTDWLAPTQCSEASTHIEDRFPKATSIGVPARDSQGVLMPPPPLKPGPTRRKPPPLVARIKARARRAKRKQQKAEYRRRLFLAHMVQATRAARQQSSTNGPGVTVKSTVESSSRDVSARRAYQQALSLFPECLGVDLASFVETVFDTDAQSSEITDPSDISDDDLARATRAEIEARKRLGGAEVVVPKGVFRWMVARDFAERWPHKVQNARKNPWPGLEYLWGLPSTVPGQSSQSRTPQGGITETREEEPMRWQSGRRSRFIRRKEGQLRQLPGVQASEIPDAARLETKNGAILSSQKPLSTIPEMPSKSSVSVFGPLQPATNVEQGCQEAVPEQQGQVAPVLVDFKVNSVPPTKTFGASEPWLNTWDGGDVATCPDPYSFPVTFASMPVRL